MDPGVARAVAIDQPELRRRLAHALPRDARGWHALTTTVREIDRIEAEVPVDAGARRSVLTEVYGGAWDAVLLRLRREFGSAPEEDLEEVIQTVWLQIDELYLKCRDRSRFSGFLWTTLRRRALARLPDRETQALDESAPAPRESDQARRAAAAQALRRFAWFTWGSQDNPLAASRQAWSHKQGRAAMVEFSAIACGLECRPYGELVYWNQPRSGDWGQGDGEGDEKWWRNRATYARGKFKRALQTDEGTEIYQGILERILMQR